MLLKWVRAGPFLSSLGGSWTHGSSQEPGGWSYCCSEALGLHLPHFPAGDVRWSHESVREPPKYFQVKSSLIPVYLEDVGLRAAVIHELIQEWVDQLPSVRSSHIYQKGGAGGWVLTAPIVWFLSAGARLPEPYVSLLNLLLKLTSIPDKCSGACYSATCIALASTIWYLLNISLQNPN